MKFKKIVSSALASALAFSMAVPAFAASSDLTATTNYEGTLQAPTISITVMDSGSVIVNPYKMSVTPSGGSATTDQIISPVQYITNASNVALNVSATVTGKLPTGKKDVTFATATTQNASKPLTTNSIFMYFEIAPASSATDVPSWPENYNAKPAADQETKQVLVAAKATTASNLLTLDVGNTTNTFAAYRLTGDAVSSPTRAWAEDDAVSVSVAFTFTPTVVAAD